jgi:hypothetical protein
MGFNWIAPDLPYTVIQIKGTTGGATGQLEYLCEAEPKSATSAAVWRIRKFVYDSAGFNTQILWASGDRSFTKVADNYASYSYS